MLPLDTCCLLWLAADQAKLSEETRRQIDEHRDQLFVSAISAFEVGTKHRKGKLELPLDPEAWFAAVLRFHGLIEAPIDSRIAARSTRLPLLHNDPCDRIIVATVQIHQWTILTPDSLIRAYPETRVVW